MKDIFNDETRDEIISEHMSQPELERLFSKYQALPCIKQEFISAGFPGELAEAEVPIDFGIEAMAQLVLHKRANFPTLAGICLKFFLDAESPAKAVSKALFDLVQQGFVIWDDVANCFVMLYDVTDDVKRKLDLYQYPLPMIEQPETVRTNRQTGYQTIRGSLILKQNHHDDDICLDHINRVNGIALSLNPDVVAFVQNKWKNVDTHKPGESREDFKARRKAFEKYNRTSKDVLAALMAQGDRFWLTHKYDKRGRTYCQGYHVTYQGNDWNKACIELADAEPLNQE